MIQPGQLVESHRFRELTTLWAAERLESELVVARALARGVIVDGLRMQSIDPRWLKPEGSLTGYPYVGYAARADAAPVLLRAEVLEHLLSVVRLAARHGAASAPRSGLRRRKGPVRLFGSDPDFRNMAVRVVRLGTPRHKEEGPRLGTVRRPPRGVRKADFARRDYYDQWLPLLSPSQPLVARATEEKWTEARWKSFANAYRREMRAPAARQVLELLASLSHHANFSIGCYCERADRCHRSVLRELLADQGAKLA